MSDAMKSVSKENFDAVLFDLDGVLTKTASLHAECWKTMFDEFLQIHGQTTGHFYESFSIERDYAKYVDGKPRYEGVESFLESRGIALPYGDPSMPANMETVCGLGNRKDELVKAAIAAGKVEVYPSSLQWVEQLRQQGFRLGVVSSSKNCEEILRVVGILDRFEVRVDGVVAAAKGIPGKPKPDTFLYAASEMKLDPRRVVVVEDALAGVEAGKNGGFGLVIGVDRLNQAPALLENGASEVVADLSAYLD